MSVGKSLDTDWQVSVVPNMHAELAPPGSDLHRAALRLQARRFGPTMRRDGGSVGSKTASDSGDAGDAGASRVAEASSGDGGTGEAYMAATDYAPDATIPVVVRSTTSAGSGVPFGILGVARLELPGSTLIEATMRLRPGSAPAQALANGRASEIGGFTTPADVDRMTLLDVVDTLVAAFLDLAEPLGLDWFWLFPRVGFMTLMWAIIPGVLPPYRYTLSPDVLGWNEGNPRLMQLRALQPRGLQDFPELYHIGRPTLREDLERRLALRLRRLQLGTAMNDALFGAMRLANHLLPQHAHTTTLAQRGPVWHDQDMEAAGGHLAGTGVHQAMSQPLRPLRPFQTQGLEYALALTGLGEALPMYKQKAYRLLALEPGVRLLDVACGGGPDLHTLAAGIGSTGRVIGLERDPELVRVARERLRQWDGPSDGSRQALAPCVVFQGDYERLAFPGDLFDLVRIDCALQRFRKPDQAIREFSRVLRPHGILAVVEPDWAALDIRLGRSGVIATDEVFSLGETEARKADEEEDALGHLRAWYQAQFPQPIIGRQLTNLLLAIGPTAWQDIVVERRTFVTSNWFAVDRALKLTDSALALTEAQPALRPMTDRWLKRVVYADTSHTFRALLPFHFVTARKARAIRAAQ